MRQQRRHPARAAGTLRHGARRHRHLRSRRPSTAIPSSDGLRPAMRLTSYVAGVRVVQPGDSVGYGRRFIAERATPRRRSCRSATPTASAGRSPTAARCSSPAGAVASRAPSAWTSSRCCCPTVSARRATRSCSSASRAASASSPRSRRTARDDQLRDRLRRGAAGRAPLRRRRARGLGAADVEAAQRMADARRAAALASGRAGLAGGRRRARRSAGSAERRPRLRRAGRRRPLGARRWPTVVGGAVFRYSERSPRTAWCTPAAHADFAPLRGESLAADLAARDFTVNALAQDCWARRELIDPLGGRADLQARRLRLCAPDALAADPVRIMRLARLAARPRVRARAQGRRGGARRCRSG